MRWPPGGSPLAMLVAKGNFGHFSDNEFVYKGGLDAFCEYGLDVDLRDFNGHTITQWIEIRKTKSSSPNLQKDITEMYDYLVTKCGAKTPEELESSY